MGVGQRMHTDKNSFTYLFLCLKYGVFFSSHSVVQVEMVVLIHTF